MIICLKKKHICICSLVVAAFLVFGAYYDGGRVSSDVTVYQGKTIVTDAGHGEPDGGCVASDGTKEADINLAIATKLDKMLADAGSDSIMTREDKNAVTMAENSSASFVKREDMYRRREIRDGSGADIFISIHQNEFSDKSCHGAQVMYDSTNEASKKLAECIQQSLKESVDSENKRQIMAAPNTIFLLKNAEVPSVIVECGFLSNPDECGKLKTDEYQTSIAKAIFTGIEKYFAQN